jgi:hypothetical protein
MTFPSNISPTFKFCFLRSSQGLFSKHFKLKLNFLVSLLTVSTATFIISPIFKTYSGLSICLQEISLICSKKSTPPILTKAP